MNGAGAGAGRAEAGEDRGLTGGATQSVLRASGAGGAGTRVAAWGLWSRPGGPAGTHSHGRGMSTDLPAPKH